MTFLYDEARWGRGSGHCHTKSGGRQDATLQSSPSRSLLILGSQVTPILCRDPAVGSALEQTPMDGDAAMGLAGGLTAG